LLRNLDRQRKTKPIARKFADVMTWFTDDNSDDEKLAMLTDNEGTGCVLEYC